MCELYATQGLEIPHNEDQWKNWAVGVKGIDVFANEGVPSPYTFDNWFDWAVAVVNAVNPAPRT